MLAAALVQPPMPVSADGPYAIHTLLGINALQDSLYTIKQLYAFLPDRPPLVFHEDGSFGQKHISLIHEQFPGARIIRRRDADREVVGELQTRGLRRCEEYRRQHVFGLKLFDLQWYAAGRRAWYVDTDIGFFERPSEILDALAEPDDAFIDRYNEDVLQFYTWSAEDVRSLVGIEYPKRAVNAGMVILRRPTLRWELFEACLELPQRTFWDEQTLWAVDFGAGSANALPPEYDVCCRYAWEGLDRGMAERMLLRGRPVISQHFSGGFAYRRLFYHQMLSDAST